jgi:leader peptidase (prepilin peptidase) / N-methyltransferase
MEWALYIPIVTWSLLALMTGLAVGSFISMLVARLPYEKSILWPVGSRCFSCYRPIRRRDNIPILSYLLLGGKCRDCKAPFSAQHLWVELGTGIAFLALFLVDVVFNRFNLPGVKYEYLGPQSAFPSEKAFAVFFYHATLVAGLIAAAAIDAEHRIIPPQVTYPIMVIGIIGGALMPWPWPHPASAAPVMPTHVPIWTHPDFPAVVPLGVQLWPFWGPTFDFAPPGSWKLGLLNAVIGALVGSLVVRAVKWLFETGFGREALGLGDADLLMMAGAFLGWQIAVFSLFVGCFAALVLLLVQRALRPDPDKTPPNAPQGTPVGGPPAPRELPFGPGLAIGVAITWFAWPKLGPRLQYPFFDGITMGVLVVVMAVGLLAAALLLRRPAEVPEPARS